MKVSFARLRIESVDHGEDTSNRKERRGDITSILVQGDRGPLCGFVFEAQTLSKKLEDKRQENPARRNIPVSMSAFSPPSNQFPVSMNRELHIKSLILFVSYFFPLSDKRFNYIMVKYALIIWTRTQNALESLVCLLHNSANWVLVIFFHTQHRIYSILRK